nr:hypothetical protein [Tanacetum cinerariifolium]
MSNTNYNLQTQTLNSLHNAIMGAGGKDRPPMLAPVVKGSLKTTTEGYMENYKNVSQDIRNELDAEAKAVQIILTGIDNAIYSIVYACLNALASSPCDKLHPLPILVFDIPLLHSHIPCNYNTESQTATPPVKLLLCKQEEAGLQLNAEQDDWRDETDDEPEDQELEAHYLYLA